ncbi:carboxypeptidase-like regulatory domain-containing protein [Olivibacter sp. CPCC 100613]|uniref:carboxypeptidase-like regulatory domain-containing protein n=1 Tax=Olivibacter sp. CPCC 100613 TaxID=3079931 RepID=UPI002FFCB6EF
MRHLNGYLLFTILSFYSLGVWSQSRQKGINLNTIVEKTNALATQQPVEKVYLHFDKPYYAVGDTLWFKSYSTSHHQLSNLSKVVYIEVLNDRDSLMKTTMISSNNGTGSGSLVLDPLLYKQGNYRVRAYTKYMMNFDPDYFFNKNITIGDVFNKRVKTHANFVASSGGKTAAVNGRIRYTDEEGKPLIDKRVSWELMRGTSSVSKGRGSTDKNGYLQVNLSSEQQQVLKDGILNTAISLDNNRLVNTSYQLRSAFQTPDVQFFPESGYLIADLPSEVAFKAVGGDGLGVAITGKVVDQQGQEVASITTQHLGMGKFTLNPKANAVYTAKVTTENGASYSYQLPKVRPFGTSLVIDPSDSLNIGVKIISNALYLEQNQNKVFSLVAQSDGVIYYAAQTPLSSASINASVPKNKFPSGIVQFTLLSPSGIPLSERLVFIQRPNELKISLNSDKKSYAAKQPVQLHLNAATDSAQSVGTFSVSVIDESKVPFNENAETTILTSLLLTSDIKGYVEQPNYYFKDITPETRSNLDILMLTQGYRRFDYKDIIGDNPPPISFLPEQGIDITGTLRLLNGIAVPNGKLELSIGNDKKTVETLSDEQGNFKFSNVMFTDSAQVTISARNNENYKNLKITLNGDAFPAITPGFTGPDEILNIDSTLTPYLKNSARQYRSERLLEEVVITERVAPKPRHTQYPALSGLSPIPDHLIDGARFTGCNLLINCLQTAAMGLTFMDNNFYITRDYNQGNRTPVQVFLNGMAIDVNGINTVSPVEVESVEIFLRDDLGTVNRTYQSNGVLVINTKKKPQGTRISKAELENLLPKSNIVTITPLGYQAERSFYLPKYTPTSAPGIDWRTTVYWNPEVITDSQGKASFQFYNASGLGTYKAVVEGIDENGNIGRAVYRYKVE